MVFWESSTAPVAVYSNNTAGNKVQLMIFEGRHSPVLVWPYSSRSQAELSGVGDLYWEGGFISGRVEHKSLSAKIAFGFFGGKIFMRFTAEQP